MPRDPLDPAEVGARLAQLPEALGMTAAELCRASGIKTNAWSNWTAARRARPDLASAMRLRRAFRVTLDWIYAGDLFSLSDDLQRRLRLTRAEAKALRSATRAETERYQRAASDLTSEVMRSRGIADRARAEADRRKR